MAPLVTHLNINPQIHYCFPVSSSSPFSIYTLHFKSLKPFLNPFTFTSLRCQNNPQSQPYTNSINNNNNNNNNNNIIQQEEEEEAREAVREYLQQIGGISTEDASLISVNCPNYVKALIDAVNDLDDWNNNISDNKPIDDVVVVEFKKKVYEMAAQKGDKGVLPFLESLGLPLSSASYLARYLSSSSLPSASFLPLLIQKVKYIKDVLFSENNGSGVIARNALRMMANLSISADDDLQQTLAFLEKIQARRGGLNLLDTEGAFPYLIESFPHLLYLPLESRVKPVLNILEDIGVPKGSMRNILLLYPPILSYDVNKVIKPRLRSYEKVGLRDSDIGKMLVKYPWILSANMLENFDKIVHFLDDAKVPRISSSLAIKNWPHILGCSVDKVKLMVEHFDEIGISDKKLGRIIAKSPQLLLRKPLEFVQMVNFFKSLGLDEEAIARTLARCPEIFGANIDKTLEKKVEFLSRVGIAKTHLPRVIRKYPDLFVCDVDRALLPRVRYLSKIGLSKKEISSMVHRFSPLLGYSIEEVLKPKIEFLVNTMGRPIKEVVEYPRYFSYSLEKKIKPRYWVMKGRNIEFDLKEMLGKNDDEFADLYLGLGEMLVPPS